MIGGGGGRGISPFPLTLYDTLMYDNENYMYILVLDIFSIIIKETTCTCNIQVHVS